MTELAVVVGTHNRLQQLRACIESIFSSTRTPFRVYVTDAGSDDGTIEFLQSIKSDRLVPVLEGERLGQARAYNRVFETLQSAYVCWLSDDNLVVNASLDTAVRILDEEPQIGLVGLKVSDMLGPFVDAPYLGGISSIGVLNVNQGVLRTRILRDVGYFSEVFQFYGIDPDLTAKVLLAGYDVVYTRDVGVHHYRAWADNESERVRRHVLQKQANKLYRRKYSRFMRVDYRTRFKRKLWAVLQSIAHVNVNSHRSVLGIPARDWRNILLGRHISLLDPVFCRHKTYHLRQSFPRSRLPRELPPDPAPSAPAIRHAVA
jgi:GT2 family glycosyltransferase